MPKFLKLLSIFLVSFFVTSELDAKDFRPAPEIATGFKSKKVAQGKDYMIVTANPHATKAADTVIKRGGNAIDAAIAAQAMLGLTEPQSSGLGGGAFVLYFDAKTQQIYAFDGREIAPKKMDPKVFMKDGETIDFYEAVLSGDSVGVPGTPRLLEAMHQKFGLFPWPEIFEESIQTAEKGFKVSPRLAKMIDEEVKNDRITPDFKTYFSNGKGRYVKAGEVLKNKDYADALKQFAQAGSRPFYDGEIAEKIVAKIVQNGGKLSAQDLKNYRAVIRTPLCADYMSYIVCSMGAPSSGGATILQILGIAEHFALDEWGKEDVRSWHVISEASRLAFMDRNKYIGDPAFVNVPEAKMVDKSYLKARAAEVNMTFSNQHFKPGKVKEEHGTSHISIIDKEGNVVSMTTTIESAFGSHLMANGFFLNNELTDFSFNPVDANGDIVVNAVEGGKRPRSSMSPTIVFDSAKRPFLVIGSAGGSRIIGYVVQRIIDVIAWGSDLKTAMDSKNILSRGPELEVETGTPKALIDALIYKNQRVTEGPQNSGLTAIHAKQDGYVGYADLRREGIALGK